VVCGVTRDGKQPPGAAVEVFAGAVPADDPAWMGQRLARAELAQAARFVHAADRRAYLAAHALLRVALDHVAGRRGQWVFEADTYGKPRLRNSKPQLFFSMSHARGRVAVAVSRHGPVGVDVETDDRAHALSGMDEAWLSASERCALARMSGDGRGEQRLAWWVAKEALVKALGLGLRQPLHELELPVFSAPDGVCRWPADAGLTAAGAWMHALHLPPAFGPRTSAAWPLRVFRGAGFRLGLAVRWPSANGPVPGDVRTPAPAIALHELSLDSAVPVFTASA